MRARTVPPVTGQSRGELRKLFGKMVKIDFIRFPFADRVRRSGNRPKAHRDIPGKHLQEVRGDLL